MSFEKLLGALPSLAKKRAPIAAPFDATKFLRWLCGDGAGMSHGELLAARLVLSVWNPDTDWAAEARKLELPHPNAATKFDVFEAATVWDGEHLRALADWLTQGDKFS